MFGGKRLSRKQYHLLCDLAKAEIEKLRNTPITLAGEAERLLFQIDELQQLTKDAHWITNWGDCY